MRLKLNNLDELKASLLYENLKESINWRKVKQMKGLYKKAVKYLKESKYEIYYEYNETNNWDIYEFVWKPIDGYNKSYRIVRLVLDNKDNNLVYLGCNCDGFKKNKICSHILATYIVLKQHNIRLKKEIEEAISRLGGRVKFVTGK